MKNFEIKEDLWHLVTSSLNENTSSGLKMAIIEADKILNYTLDKKGVPGDSTEAKLAFLRTVLSNFEELKKALKKKKEILNSFDYNLTSLEAEDVIDVYKRAIDDIQGVRRFNLLQKGFIFIQKNFPKIKSKKRIWIFILGTFLFIWFLADTPWGQRLSQLVAGLFHFLFSFFLIFLFLGIGIVIVILASFFYFEKRGPK